tara:strand:+ start:382 stop:663 length:282 start_codon:yes stop_codon:yes gene_type:complete
MAFAFLMASDLDDAPHARKLSNKRVGFPFLYSGPGMCPIRAKKLARRGLLPDFTGAFMWCPFLLYDALPFAFRPPFLFWPAFRDHAGVLGIFL